jgi:hypothetical protein
VENLLKYCSLCIFWACPSLFPKLQGRIVLFREQGGIATLFSPQGVRLDPDCTSITNLDVLLVLFGCNFIGIVFSRSLHYQFYSWYFYSLPYLLFRIGISIPLKLILFGVIEYCWNVYPSTVESSILLLAAHVIVLAALLLKM